MYIKADVRVSGSLDLHIKDPFKERVMKLNDDIERLEDNYQNKIYKRPCVARCLYELIEAGGFYRMIYNNDYKHRNGKIIDSRLMETFTTRRYDIEEAVYPEWLHEMTKEQEIIFEKELLKLRIYTDRKIEEIDRKLARLK